MSRFLHRPMFRRGGSAGEGITSGLRQGYKEGDLATIKSQLDLINTLAPEPEAPKRSSSADFWLNLGTSILAQPGGRPILQTVGTAAREPLAQLQQQRSQENLLDYKSQQGQRALVAELVQGLDDEQLSAMMKRVNAGVKAGYYKDVNDGIIRQLQKEEYGVQKMPGEASEERINFFENYLMNQTNKPPASAVRAIANHLYKMETGGYDDQLGETGVADLGSKVWFSDLDLDQTVEGGAAHIENGEIIKYKLSQNGINKWSPYKGKIVFDYRTGKLFRVMGTFLEVVEDINEG
jgi:hypothetical protein